MKLKCIAAVCLGMATLLSSGCATNYSVLHVTRTGGDFGEPVRVDVTGNPELNAIEKGDVVAVSPGAIRNVVSAPPLFFTLIEPESTTKKALQVNPREYAKIELIRGVRKRDFLLNNIYIERGDSTESAKTVSLLAFNRSKKAFRGDLTIYDYIPDELEVTSISEASRFRDQKAAKSGLRAIPLIGLITLAMNDYQRIGSAVPMTYEEVKPGLYKFIIPRIIIEPGTAVGFDMMVKYQPPLDEEIDVLREYASSISLKPATFKMQNAK